MLDRQAWVRILPFATYLFFLLINDMLLRLGLAAEQLRWLYGVRIASVVLILALCWRHYSELVARPSMRQLGLAVLCGVLLWGLWISLDAGWMRIGSPTGFDPRQDGVIDWWMVAMRIAGAAVVVPLMEELFWRSFLLRFLDKPDFLAHDPAAISGRALIIASLLFGIEHSEWLAGIIAGLAYGGLYWYSRNLWTVVVAHGVTNAVLGGWVVTTASWTYW